MYLTASGITDPTRKRALLLYQAGPRVREIFKQIPDTGTSADYDTAKDKLKAHFDPQKNKRYEVYRFRQATQESNETLDQFHTRLHTMAETCEFTDIEFEIEEQIIIGGRSSKIRKRALRDPTFDLKAMLIEGRRDEQSTFQTKEIESKETKDGETNRLAQQHGNNISNYKSTCKNCGREFPHKGACPARGKTCNNRGFHGYVGHLVWGAKKTRLLGNCVYKFLLKGHAIFEVVSSNAIFSTFLKLIAFKIQQHIL